MNRSILNLFETYVLLALCVLFFIMPKGASDFLIWSCLFLFYAVFIGSLWNPIVIAKNITTFFKIDTFFYLFSFVIYFLPYQLYVLELKGLETQKFATYEEYTNGAILLSIIGVLSFKLGFNFYKGKKFKKIANHVSRRYSNVLGYIVFLLMTVILILFFNTGATTLFAEVYIGSKMGSATYDAIFSLVSFFIILGVIQAFSYRYFFGKFKFLWIVTLLIAVLWSLALLYVGDRNTFFLIALVIISTFFTYFRSVSRLSIAIFVIIALILYQVVEVTRTMENKDLDGLQESFSIVNEQTDDGLAYETSLDITTVGLRASLKAIEEDGFYLGKFKLVSLMSIIPYSSRLFIDSDDEITGSSKVIKREMIGLGKSWGTGTNIISDAFTDFGLFGVVIIMYLFGRFGGYAQIKAQTQITSVKWMFIYIITLAHFSELVRYGFDFPLRAIVWTFLLFSLMSFLPGLSKNNSDDQKNRPLI